MDTVRSACSRATSESASTADKWRKGKPVSLSADVDRTAPTSSLAPLGAPALPGVRFQSCPAVLPLLPVGEGRWEKRAGVMRVLCVGPRESATPLPPL